MESPFSAYQGDDPFVFISYSHADLEEVYPDLAMLNESTVNVWYDEGIVPGFAWREEVAEAIVNSSLLIYFISPDSIASQHCLREINFALAKQKHVLCVHLRQTQLTIGLEFSLNENQAIFKNQLKQSEYLRKLLASSSQLLEGKPKPGPRQQVRANEADCIAILPFRNLNQQPENDYLSEGISLELTNRISRLGNLDVIYATSFKDHTMALSEVGRELGVKYCLSGGLQVAGDHVRISVRLEETSRGKALFVHRFDHTLDNVFALQDDIADSVLHLLCTELGVDSQKISKPKLSEDSEAYSAFLHGGFAERKDTLEGYEEAIQQYTYAAKVDPDFGKAYFQLGICYWRQENKNYKPHFSKMSKYRFSGFLG
jgi:TolB-like protein